MIGSTLADSDYLPSVAARALRWAPEMHEIADTLREAGLPPELAEGAAAVLRRWQDDKDNAELSLGDTLERLRGQQ